VISTRLAPPEEIPEAGVWMIEADAESDGHILLAGASPAALSP